MFSSRSLDFLLPYWPPIQDPSSELGKHYLQQMLGRILPGPEYGLLHGRSHVELGDSRDDLVRDGLAFLLSKIDELVWNHKRHPHACGKQRWVI